MAATNQKIKDFFALTGNNPAVTAGQLTKVSEAIGATINEDGSPATADQLVDYVYQELKNLAIYHNQDLEAATARSGVTF